MSTSIKAQWTCDHPPHPRVYCYQHYRAVVRHLHFTSRHKTLNQCWVNVGPPPTTLSMQKLTLLTTVCYHHALFLLALECSCPPAYHKCTCACSSSTPVVHQATIMQATARTHSEPGSPRTDSQILRPHKQQYLTSSALSSGNNR